MREVLTVRGLRSGYDGSTVLHGVDLAVREGQVVARSWAVTESARRP